jgi:hypothetical protein
MDGGPVHEYIAARYHEDWFENVNCIAVDQRYRTLLGGGSAGIVRWDLETGAS